VTEGIEELDQEQLRLALFVALELGGKFGEFVEGAFLRSHPAGSLTKA
jgi:hypothetical protein